MKHLAKLSLLISALGIALALPPVASAASFHFSFVADDGSVLSGNLFGDLVNPGTYAISGGSATLVDSVAGGQFAGAYNLVANPNSPGTAMSVVPVTYFEYNDLLYPNASAGELLDYWGLLFANGPSTLAINIWGNGSGQPYTWNLDDSGGYREGGYGKFAVTQPAVSATPEPGSMLLLGTGILALALIAFRRARRPALTLPL